MKYLRVYILVAAIIMSALSPTKAYAYELPDYLSIWFPQWFGDVDDGPDPAETLQAPFTAPGTVPKDPGSAIGVPHSYTDDVNMNDLSQPHRNAVQVGEWLTRALSEVLTINPDSTLLQVHFGRLKTGMSIQAINSYKKFLADNAVLDTLRTNGMLLSSVINDKPLLLNEGIVDGRYRWLFQVPVTMTYTPKGAVSLSSPEVIHQNATLMLQVGRVTDGVQGKAIETWQVKSIEPRVYPNKDKK